MARDAMHHILLPCTGRLDIFTNGDRLHTLIERLVRIIDETNTGWYTKLLILKYFHLLLHPGLFSNHRIRCHAA